MLAVENAGEQHAGIRHEVAAGFAHQGQPGRLHLRRHGVGERLRAGRLLVVVADAEPAADVQRLEGVDPRRAQRRHQLEQLGGPARVGLNVMDLGPDVHRERAQHERSLGRDAARHAHHLVERHPKLGGLLARLGVRMRVRADVRIDPNAHRCGLADLARHRDHRVELARRLDVEESHAHADCLRQLVRRLANPRVHERPGIEPGRQRPLQLPRGHDVRARAEALQHAQHAEVAVRLDRIADAVGDALQGVVQRMVLRADQVGAVDVDRRADALRDRAQQRRVEPEGSGAGSGRLLVGLRFQGASARGAHGGVIRTRSRGADRHAITRSPT